MQYTQYLTLDVFKQEQFQYIHAVQFDHLARQLVITLMANGEPMAIPSTAKAVFRCLKHDGTSVLNPVTLDTAAGTVTFELTDQTLACEGLVRADISIIDGERVISTLTFYIMVEKAPTSDSQIESSDEFLYLVQVASEVEAYTERAEVAAASTEKLAADLENVTVELEEAKAYSESAVASANAAAISANNASGYAENASTKATEAAGSATAALAAQKAAELARDAASEIAGGDFATRAELTNHVEDQTLHITAAERTAWNAKSDFSGSYNDLKDKPTIPKELPTVTTADNDKILMVVGGVWTAAAIVNAEGVAY